MGWLLLLLLFPSVLAGDCSTLCNDVNNICQITNVTKFCSSSLIIATGFTIQISNSVLYCVHVDNIGEPNCTISLQSRSVTITNSTLVASLISVQAREMLVSADSVLNANGTGYHLGPGNAGDFNSPSYGGRGGGTCGELTRYLTYGDQYDPRTFYGSGSMSKYSNGGGQILINAQNFTLKGLVSACGNLPVNNQFLGTPSKYPASMSGGTGGTIYINVGQFADMEQGLVLANGGNGGEEGYGGGGGRIALYGPIERARVRARGGWGGHKRCPNGGAGTIYYAKDDLLVVDNNNLVTRNPTPVATRPTLSLRIENNALATPAFSHQSMTLKSLYISSSRLEASQVAGSGDSFDTALVLIVGETIMLSNQGTIGSTEVEVLCITAKKLVADASSGLFFATGLNITAESVLLKCDVEGNSILSDQSQILIEAKDSFTLLSEASMKAKKIGISADHIHLEGSIDAAEKTCTEDLHFFEKNPPFHYIVGEPGKEVSNPSHSLSDLLSSNFTCLLIARVNFTMTEISKVLGARIGVFGETAYLQGVISASGYGCPSDKGPGRGSAKDRLCSASGAGYGGVGGPGMDLNDASAVDCQAEAPPGRNYSDVQSPWFEGSGGGSISGMGGAGGGFVDVEMLTSIFITGFISADGSDGPRHPSDLRGGSGGGSGGGIFISTKNISGTKSTIKANGGRGSIKSGGGSGGRILFGWFGAVLDGVAHNKENFAMYWTKQTVAVLGGNPGPANATSVQGSFGSRAARSCAPGSYEFSCKPCDVGYYKEGTNYSDTCHQCENGPTHAIYLHGGMGTSKCEYACPTGYSPADINPDCKSPAEEFFDVFGGLAGALAFFVITLVLIALLPIGIFMLYQRYRTRAILHHPLLTPLEHIDRMERKLQTKKTENPELNKEDLPFHEKRIFLLGDNNYYKPWSLPKAPPAEIEDQVVLEEYSNFATAINNHTRWFPWQHCLCVISLWVYHPFGLYILHTFRKRKYWNVRVYIMKYNEILWRKIEDRQLSNSLRISCSDDFTLAYLDITSLSRPIVQWDERPNLPLTLLSAGDGSFWNAFHLDTKDLMIQLIGWGMDSEAREEYQDFLNLFNMNLKTVVLDTPVPDKTQREITELQSLVLKYNSELFHSNDYHATLALFQAPIVIEKGKYVQVRWSGELNSKNIGTYSLDVVNTRSKCLYSFKLGLIFTKYFRSPDAPELRRSSYDSDPSTTSQLYFNPSRVSSVPDNSLFSSQIKYVSDPIDSASFYELSLRSLLLVSKKWNQYVGMFFLLFFIFIDVVRGR